MQPFLRASLRVPRARTMTPLLTTAPPKRFAHEAYGNTMSGHQQSDKKNPKEHMEHPGPEAPASKGSASSSSSSSSTQSSDDTEKTAAGSRPKIHSPESAAEKDDPEVRKHNEEMKNRNDRSVNQLSEEDNKVNKKFWKGDVGGENVKKD